MTAADECPVCEDIAFLRGCGESDDAIAVRLGYRNRRYIMDHLLRHRKAS